MSVRTPIDLSTARVLIVNDDGIDAHGLGVLEESIRPHVGELWVCAPSEGHSGASAMVSLRREVDILNRGERRFAVTGRPADSVQAALRLLMTETPPDLVLSGVNHGINIGSDLIYSGTVGAALSAAVNGIPAIALSADHPPKQAVTEETWEEVARLLPGVVRRICSFGFPTATIYGVNFPISTTSEDPMICRQSDVGDTFYYSEVAGVPGRYRLHHGGEGTGGLDGTDLGAVAAGRIGITPITCDRTNHALLREAAEAL
ncbi:5'/3'-nucleotidase SurE [Rhodospirillaceae bacterium KN72]|uniref:5'-nucleotidase n=1 Tax=Pacificispira spongiicola TaxID=2729598 RepID=A0A7Y0E091_9PROT|nr:5'/3'-nucleotidase SurE [Pacificispira spongiicola]NMM44086.1 5'/3'-nucleotidase SurE [Pacificispira spongiicola]